jgi:hypothetical protein
MIQSKTVILSHPIRPSLSSGFVAARELAHRYGTVVRAFALRQLQTQQFDLQELRHETFLSCEAGSGTRTVADLIAQSPLHTGRNRHARQQRIGEAAAMASIWNQLRIHAYTKAATAYARDRDPFR